MTWPLPFAVRTPPGPWMAVGGIAVAVVAMPVGNVEVPGLGMVLILPATAAACLIAATMLLAARRPFAVRSAVLAFGGAGVVAAAIAAVMADDPGVALRVTLIATAGLLLAVLTAATCRSVRHWYGLLGVLLAVGAAVCLASLSGSLDLQAGFGAAVVAGRPTGTFVQPNELGGFAAVITVLAVGVLATTRRPAAAVAAAAVLVVALPALALSLSRGAWIGTVVGIGVLAVALSRARGRLLLAAAAATLAIGGIAAVSDGRSDAPRTAVTSIVLDRAATVLNSSTNPYDDRPAIWREALRQVASSPVLGHGPGNYPLLAEVSSSGASGVQAEHAHNLVLTTAAETGLLGVALLICAVAAGVVSVGRTLRTPGRSANPQGAVLMAAALAVVLGQGVVDYVLRNSVLAILTWLLVGLLVAATTATPSGRPQNPDNTRRSAAHAGFGARS